jgi:hypothetical protein
VGLGARTRSRDDDRTHRDLGSARLVHPSDAGLGQGLPSTRRQPTGHDDVGTAAPVGDDPACVAQVSLTDPLDLEELVSDDQIRPCLALRHLGLHRAWENAEDCAYGSLGDIPLACVGQSHLQIPQDIIIAHS